MRLITILASVRQGRFAPAIDEWVQNAVAQRADIEHDHIDLAEHQLPMDMGPARSSSSVEVLGKQLDVADAFLLITPEYNHSFPASLKLLLDTFTDPWAAKPFAFVGYGGQAGGMRSIYALRPVISELHGMPIRDAVCLSSPWEHIDTDGRFSPDERSDLALATTLDRLTWWSDALAQARSQVPYAPGH